MIISKGMSNVGDFANELITYILINIIKIEQIDNIPKLPNQLKQPINILGYLSHIIIYETEFYYIVE